MPPQMLSASLLLTATGAVLLYLGSPNQRWLMQPLTRAWSRLGALLQLPACAVWMTTLSALAGFFAWATELMLLLSLLPLVGLWRSQTRGLAS